MEFKGTKGNWELDRNFYKDQDHYDVDSGSVQVATVYDIYDAKLIASALDLLKAAIKLSNAISNGDAILLSEGNFEIKTAIKKAIG